MYCRMKIYLNYLLFLGFVFFADGQSTVVEYHNYKRNEDQHYQSFLIIEDGESYCLDIFHKTFSSYDELMADEDFVENLKYLSSIKKDSLGSDVYYGIASIPGEGRVLYKDIIPKIEWKISPSDDQILGYPCSQAIGEFRGRIYKVWFTTQIPLSEGPWKIGNFPGLVMKVVVDNGLFTFEAVNIVIRSDNILIPQKYIEAYHDATVKNVSYQAYIKMENKVFGQIRNEQISNLPKGVVLSNVPPIRTTFIEKSFEWDKE